MSWTGPGLDRMVLVWTHPLLDWWYHGSHRGWQYTIKCNWECISGCTGGCAWEWLSSVLGYILGGILWSAFRVDFREYTGSVSNGSSFGPGQFYRSAWQRPHPIKNRRFFKWTITLRPQILIRECRVWYVKYVAQHGASFGCLQFSISSNLSKQ